MLPDLTTVNAPVTLRSRRGPIGACDVYGPGDVEDWQKLEAYRALPKTWAETQALIDSLLGIEQPIKLDHFRYHWRKKCAHWDHLRWSA